MKHFMLVGFKRSNICKEFRIEDKAVGSGIKTDT